MVNINYLLNELNVKYIRVYVIRLNINMGNEKILIIFF